MDSIKQTFFQECEDLLDELESGLLMINEGYGDSETINGIFRAVHSIKGGAGAFGLDDLVHFAHTFENTLDEVRGGNLETSENVLKLFLQCSDMLSDLVMAARDDEDCDTAKSKELIKELQVLCGVEVTERAEAEEEADEDDVDYAPVMLDLDFGDMGGDDEEESPSGSAHIIQFTPKAGLYKSGNETVRLLRELAELGTIEAECDSSTLPDFEELDPEGAYLSWTVTLETEKTEEAILEVFEFVEDECDLKITEQGAAPAEIEADLDEEPDAPEEVAAEATPVEEDATPEPAVEEPSPALVAEAEKPATAAAPATPDAAQPKKEKTGPQPTIRVNLDRVDRLINLVGELVINQAMLAQGVSESELVRDAAVGTGLDEFKQLTREIQESVMAIRAQPVKSLFQRMSRIVREASNATDKSVRLVTEGEATEVDKTVVEKLADPLTHMIRNAVDHGLETPEDRVAKGKPEQGTVKLTAAHRSGKIIIEVSDDGAGINRERVKQIAIDKELIPADAQLSDSEIDNLLFMPGFSTAKSVSNLSGRGVGMDVVKRSIQAVGGRVTIASQPGKGSTFTISLPLTLAVLDGMVVHAADQTLVVPLTAVVETLLPKKEDIHALGPDASVISIRGEFIPIIDVGVELGFRDEPSDYNKSVLLSVETDEGERCALLVDAIQDQRQVVIKSLEDNYGNVPGIAAATILGDGRIALIVDVDSVVARSGGNQAFTEAPLAAAG
jgi:two-component system chemotaxis sensor kinase CheA